jgi:hypothetical protein
VNGHALPCRAQERHPAECKREHKCYLYLDHYGQHKAKRCLHYFEADDE